MLVHLGTDRQAAVWFARWGLDDVERIADPGARLFAEFGLVRGGLKRFLAPRVFWRAFVAGLLKGHLVGRPVGDALQLGGAFVLAGGAVVAAHKNRDPSDRPDYLALVERSGTCPTASS